MPYACSVEGGAIRLEPAAETAYAVIGKREEQPFTVCPTGEARACDALMVHKFTLSCGGEKVAWARVAAAAQASGIIVPRGLPGGFAPVTSLGGRFVLPALPHSTALVSHVATQELSADSVVERQPAEAEEASQAAWAPVVKADMDPRPSSAAFRVAAALAVLLPALFAGCMLAARRWRMPEFAGSQFLQAAQSFWVVSSNRVRPVVEAVMARAAGLLAALTRAEPEEHDDQLGNAIAIVKLRLLDTEQRIAALPADILLREVLGSELNGVRQRLASLERGIGRTGPEKSAAVARVILRDLDRIGRIAESAAETPGRDNNFEAQGMPRSAGEAYQVLGLNANAPVEVAKRLVDALRMSWHPDHASDEADRRRREARIKQINAAWDIVNGRREAA